ncbi:MAG: hypothetical protein GTO02_21495 [Candidatus Dadabacteria bacterium]|nr:hypothetical protein [Candidatus Dadabacteria bacterium]
MRAFKHRNPPQRIPNSFNRLNVLEKGKDVQNRFLHYTIEPQQPWYNPRHPYTSLWEIELQAAIEAGVVLKEEIEEQVRKYRPHTNTKRGEGMNPYWIKYALG